MTDADGAQQWNWSAILRFGPDLNSMESSKAAAVHTQKGEENDC